MSLLINSFFTNTGFPELGLSPTIRIWEVNGTSHTLVLGSSPIAIMTEIGDGFYKFEFTNALGYDATKKYVFRADGGNTLPTTERYQEGATEEVSINEEDKINIVDQVWDEIATDHINSGTFGLFVNMIKTDTTLIAACCNLVRKFHTNRTFIDKTNKQLIIFEDNDIDILWKFNLQDGSGNIGTPGAGTPSIAPVCEKIPTS